MKTVKNLLFAAALILAGMTTLACNKPKIISDDKLTLIFHDIYLTNTYVQNHRIQTDSLNIYEPVFAKYGHTTEDMQFTIGNFAKRKSIRLSDIVDRSIEMLETESRFYAHRIAIYDSIGELSRQRLARVVYNDTLIEVKKIADTSKLRIVIPIEPGIYELSYGYTLDSADLNDIRVNHYLRDARGRQSGSNSRRLRRGAREKVTATFKPGGEHQALVLNLNGYGKEMKRPNLTIDSLTVKYYLPDRVARDSMARTLFGIHRIDSLKRIWMPAPDNSRFSPFLPDDSATEDLVPLPSDS